MIEDEVGALLRQLGWTIGTAETCTGGLIAHRLIGVAGSSAYVRGGVVAYANGIKVSLLGIAPAVIAEHGVVSATTALALALAARTALGVDLGLATTGIAGPADPARRSRKPVGLVYVAAAWPAGSRVEEHQWPAQDRRANMAASAEAALRLAAAVAREALAGPR
ncbi:MAG: CinA family protein [Chloroflexi bacterium]|nr:CinA family protein [Chloroflexota bacterium]